MSLNNQLQNLAAILLAYTIKQAFPDIKLGSSKISEEGFSYSFSGHSFSLLELPKIKKKMESCISANHKIYFKKISLDEAKTAFKSEPFKLQLLKEKNIDVVLINDKIFDLCQPLDIVKFQQIKELSLTNVAGVYWDNNINNEQLSTIYGFACESKKELDDFLIELNDRKERDHRNIGKELELFTFDLLAGQGLPIWLPNGEVIKNKIEQYIYALLTKNNYQFVSTPILGSQQLYEISGHWSHYRENMFPSIKVENETFIMRPMTCPHHLLVYKMKPRSYKELPIRFAEKAILHRYEHSGALTGLERVRMMSLIDTHIICTHDQIDDVVQKCYNIIKIANDHFNIKLHSIDLSLHGDDDKFEKNDQMWKNAEDKLRDSLNKLGVKYNVLKGEAAFYGPKIDMQVKTALGRVVTAYTIQLDFSLPSRFELKYINSEGKEETPVLIHASVIGTLERFMSILLEQNKGIFPLELAPKQVVIIPVNAAHNKYCQTINDKLIDNDFRSFIDFTDERLGKKIRNAQIKKIPYQIVIGDNEVQKQIVSFRKYGQETVVEKTLDEFIKMLNEESKK